jgi:hypothetical protein
MTPTGSARRYALAAPDPDWRRIHTRYDRCAHTFTSAIALAAVMLF